MAWRFPNFTLGCRIFATPCAVLEKLRRLLFSRRRLRALRVRLRRIFPPLRCGAFPLHGFALFNHNQETLFCSDYSGLRPIYATQSHPQILLSTYAKSLSGAKLRSGNAPAPKASGRVSATRELRSSRKAPRGSPNARSFYHLEACCSTKFFDEP